MGSSCFAKPDVGENASLEMQEATLPRATAICVMLQPHSKVLKHKEAFQTKAKLPLCRFESRACQIPGA